MRRGLLAACLLVLAEAAWEFGQDHPNLDVISIQQGNIKNSEKITHIQIPLYECIDIKYILINVYNWISTPAVTYNKRTQTVSIKYKRLQLPFSSYEIITKGIRLQCNQNNPYATIYSNKDGQNSIYSNENIEYQNENDFQNGNNGVNDDILVLKNDVYQNSNGFKVLRGAAPKIIPSEDGGSEASQTKKSKQSKGKGKHPISKYLEKLWKINKKAANKIQKHNKGKKHVDKNDDRSEKQRQPLSKDKKKTPKDKKNKPKKKPSKG